MASHVIPSLSLPGTSGALLLKDRSELLSHFELKGKRCVEIGSLYGNFAAEILFHQPTELFLVDPWTSQPLIDYLDISNLKTDSPELNAVASPKMEHGKSFEDVYLHCRQRFETQIISGQIKMMRMFSHHGARQVPNGLDMVYIDGNHAYNWVLSDLFLWYPKIKPGGWLAGHDYLMSDFLGVEQAVSQFCAMTKLKVDVETNESDFTSFAIQIKE